jgi:hypothetical protein
MMRGGEKRSEEKNGSRSFFRTISDIFLRKIMAVRFSSLMFQGDWSFRRSQRITYGKHSIAGYSRMLIFMRPSDFVKPLIKYSKKIESANLFREIKSLRVFTCTRL